MSQSYYGSICFTDILEKCKAKHPAVTKGQNGKIYVNINVWLNDQPDQYGNVLAIQLSEKKEQKVNGKSFYLGNCKKSTSSELTDKDTDFDIPDDIPTRESTKGGLAFVEPGDDGLPF